MASCTIVVSTAHVRVVVKHSPTFDVGVELRPAFNRFRESKNP